MNENPYAQFPKDKMILRDYLATDRTILANERTFLAYIRTALAIFAVGASLILFFDYILAQIIGWIFVPAGFVTFIIGLLRYRKMKSFINKIHKGRALSSHSNQNND